MEKITLFLPRIALLAEYADFGPAHMITEWAEYYFVLHNPYFLPEVEEWCRAHLLGPYGIMDVDVPFDPWPSQLPIWFSSERDAMLFKLRWWDYE